MKKGDTKVNLDRRHIMKKFYYMVLSSYKICCF